MRLNRRDAVSIGLLAAGGLALTGRPGNAVAAQARRSGSDDPRPLTVSPPPSPLTAPAAVAQIEGAGLWYWDTGGSGEAVVLLHAGTGSGLVWGYQQAAFAAAGFRVIGYSRRGFNGSTAVDSAKPGTSADDLRMLLDHLRIRKAHLVGTAAGGFTAASFALMWPDRVHSLVLACTLLSGAERAVTSMLTFSREPWYNALPHEFRELGPSYRAIDKEGVQRWHDLHAVSRGDNAATSQPAGEPATLAAIARLAMPVLLLSGDADPISPPPVARLFHAAIPGSTLIVLTECGHSAYWERPQEFNAAVIGFLRGSR